MVLIIVRVGKRLVGSVVQYNVECGPLDWGIKSGQRQHRIPIWQHYHTAMRHSSDITSDVDRTETTLFWCRVVGDVGWWKMRVGGIHDPVKYAVWMRIGGRHRLM